MVYPAPLAGAANPPLSYAERVKKAQNAKPSAQSAPQRSVSQGAFPMISAASSSAVRPAAAPTPSAAPLKATPSTPLSSDSRISSAAPLSSSSKPTMPPSHDVALEPRPNGDLTSQPGSDSGASAPNSAPAPKQAAAPPVNVWNVRKEQMARVLTQSRPSQSLPSSQSAPSALLSPTKESFQEISLVPPVSAIAGADVVSTRTSPAPKTNGHSTPPTTVDYDDPFVVRPGRSPASLSQTPPAIDDTENWPEVGQAAAAQPITENAKGREGREDDEGKHEREPSQGHGTRKGAFPCSSYVLSTTSSWSCIPFHDWIEVIWR